MIINGQFSQPLDLSSYAIEINMVFTLMLFLFFGVYCSQSVQKELSLLKLTPLSRNWNERASLSTGPWSTMWVDWGILWCFCSFFVLLFVEVENAPLLSGVYCRSTLSLLFSKYVFFFTGMVLALTRTKRGGVEYAFLIILCAFSMHMLLMSVDLISLYLSLELQSFCIVVLSVMSFKAVSSVEAALKYFLLSAFSSAILVLGISLCYFFLGFTDCATIMEALSDISGHKSGIWLVISCLFILVGLLWKLAAAPLHMWAADVYGGIPSGTAMFLSTLPKLAVLGFWISVWHINPDDFSLPFFAAACLIIGAFSALGQVNIKRLLAYSSIAQMGFLLTPLCAQPFGIFSASALITQLVLYVATSLGIWGLIVWGRQTPQYLWHWSKLNWISPHMAATMALLLMSLAGLPPLAGFVGKLGIFQSAIQTKDYALVLIGLFSTGLSTYYYVRMIRIMYSDDSTKVSFSSVEPWSVFSAKMAPSHAYVLTLITLFTVTLLWYSGPLTLYHSLIGIDFSS